MTSTNNTENDEEVEDADVQAIEEEFWPIAPTTTTIAGGANMLLAGHRTHAIYFGSIRSSTSSSDNDNCNNNNNNDTQRINDSKCGGRVLRYKSMSSEAMTPLDMTYTSGGPNDADAIDDDVDDDDNEFYDGTGNLMWMAAVCFGHLVAQQIEPLRSYLSSDLPPPITTTTTTKPCYYNRHNHHHHDHRRSRYHRRVCELGCGTGGAGISLLLFSNNHNNNNNNNPSAECESKSKFESKSGSKSESKFTSESKSGSVSGSCHVVFTDNDIESLELCKSNCELNEINPNNYSHRLLGWGLQQQQQQQQQQKEQEQRVEQHQDQEQKQEEKNDHHHRYHLDDIDRYSFDTVLATDVVYDLKMIAPLLQTAEFLLKQRTTTTNQDDDEDDDDDDGGQLILSHIPRFFIPKNNDDGDDVNDRRGENSDRNVDSDIKFGEQPNSDSDIVATTSTSTSTSTTLYNNQAYLDLEKFIQSEAIKVGLSLIETIRPHETLSNEYLFGNDNDNDNDDDDSMQQITLENMKEAHAVVFIFNRTHTLP